MPGMQAEGRERRKGVLEERGQHRSQRRHVGQRRGRKTDLRTACQAVEKKGSVEKSRAGPSFTLPSSPLLQHTNSGFWTQELAEHLPYHWRAGAMSRPHHH